MLFDKAELCGFLSCGVLFWWSSHGAVKSQGVFLSGYKVCDDDFLCVSLIPLLQNPM